MPLLWMFYGKISTHALREEGDGCNRLPDRRWAISTHALREEGDVIAFTNQNQFINFYPRPPRGGRPGDGNQGLGKYVISTHALREEGDGNGIGAVRPDFLFLPTPSARRATACCWARDISAALFLPTPSARRATRDVFLHRFGLFISTHALREEGDQGPYPLRNRIAISTHALREEGDQLPKKPE